MLVLVCASPSKGVECRVQMTGARACCHTLTCSAGTMPSECMTHALTCCSLLISRRANLASLALELDTRERAGRASRGEVEARRRRKLEAQMQGGGAGGGGGEEGR
eukprot:Tamp_35432.p3 GENE.Tamp_35432~~Tamp_35432.p3  ORF type:complete len:106 (-),score=11.31 Tamp_35432:203-520(-)